MSGLEGRVRARSGPREEKPVFQTEGHPAQIDIAGALTTPGPEFELIPTVGLVRLAERFSLGEVRKGEKAWNAMSENQDCLLNKAFILNRLGHVIAHVLKLRDKIAKNLPFEDDDAAAIAWGGIFAICATDAIEKQRAESPSQYPSNNFNGSKHDKPKERQNDSEEPSEN